MNGESPADEAADGGNGSALQSIGDGQDEVDISDQGYSVYQCSECDNLVLSVRPTQGALSCHGSDMEEITDWQMDIETPELREVLLNAFGLPKVGIDICLCVIDQGPMSPADVGELLDYDESTVSRYLNSLVDIGLLQKSQLNREGGGVVNVYHSIDIERMRRETLIGFYVWAGEAATLIEEANLTKEQYLDEDHSDGLQEIFWEDFEQES